MKILFLIDSLRSGGKERRLVELLKGLKEYPEIQYEVAVISKEVSFQEVFELNAKVHYLIRKWKKDPRILLKLNKLCMTFRPNIIHTWGYLASMYALPIAKWRGIKFVNGYITYALPVQKFSKLWFGAMVTFPFSNAVIANSKAGLKAHKLEISNKNICIKNGFDVSRLEQIVDASSMRERFGIQTKYIVGMVANFTPAKDYYTYLGAARMILKKRKDVTFLCVGSGENLARSKIPAGAEFSDNIKFLGEQKAVESIVNMLDVGVLACNTNGHAEGISNTVMEYMALGKPVVVTGSGGNKELVVDNETGFIVQPFDIEEMARRIEEILDDAVMNERMGKAGRIRIEKNFSLKKMTNAYVSLYNNL